MAKIIKYQFVVGETNNGTEDNPNIEQILLDAKIICRTQEEYDNNYPIAEKEAVGEIIADGEFDPEPVAEPTADEVLNAMLGVM